MARKRKPRKHSLSPDFLRDERQRLVRCHRKTFLLNDRELSLLDQYCEKYSIRNKSAFIRNIVVSHILEQMDDNYPKLF